METRRVRNLPALDLEIEDVGHKLRLAMHVANFGALVVA